MWYQVTVSIRVQSGKQNNSFSFNACMLSRVWLFAVLWTVARWAPLSMGFSRQEYWSEQPFPPPGDLPDPGIEPVSASSSLAGGFFTSEAPWEAQTFNRGFWVKQAVEEPKRWAGAREQGTSTVGSCHPWDSGRQSSYQRSEAKGVPGSWGYGGRECHGELESQGSWSHGWRRHSQQRMGRRDAPIGWACLRAEEPGKWDFCDTDQSQAQV